MSRTKPTPPRTVRVSQNAETEVSFLAAPGANLRYAYFRSSDSVANQIEGQDYLVFKAGERRLAFVVCDGVGSSFCGNIAARVLGDELVEWLWGLEADNLSTASALSETAKSYLLKLQPKAEREVSRYQIPDHLPPLVQQALEAQRAYGSEAVFVGGRIDHPTSESPAGRLLLVWMGDTQAHLYDDAGNEIDIGASFNPNDRWSSTQGVRGVAHSWVGPAEDVARLVVFSDGISGHADKLTAYSDIELEAALQAQFRTPNSDDVALLDVVRHTPAYLGLTDQGSDATLGAPELALIEKDRRDSTYRVRWNWDGGRAKFELQEATNPAFLNPYTEQLGNATEWQTEEPRPPGRYYYRVRAVVGRKGTAGPWSAPQTARVAYPPPEAPEILPVGPTPVEGAYTVGWTEVDNAQEYVLEEANNDDFSDATPVYRGRGNNWHTGASRDPMRYHYRVQAVNDGGASAWSVPHTVSVVVPPPPVPTVAFIREVPPGTPFTVSWSDVAQATTYEVQEIDEATGEEHLYQTGDNRLTVDVRPAGRYSFRVRACHQHGCSEWSHPQTAVVLPEPPDTAPQLSHEGPDANHQLALEWTPVERATGYVLEEAHKPTFRGAMPMQMADRTRHTLLRREPGLYNYRVRGENVSGHGPWSEPVEVVVRPGRPAWIEVNIPDETKPRVEVSWDAVPGQVGYELEFLAGATDPEMDDWSEAREAYLGREPASALRVAQEVREFAFRVRATHPEGGFGDWRYSQVISRIGPPDPPQLAEPEFQPSGEVLIRWEPVAEATGYEIEHARDDTFADTRIYQTDRLRFLFKPHSGERSWFRVRACNDKGCGDPSEPVQVIVGRLPAPKLLLLQPASPDAPLKISWSEVPGAVQYEIQQAADASFQTVERHVVDASLRDWTLPADRPTLTYVRVGAIGPDGRASDWSEVLPLDPGQTGT